MTKTYSNDESVQSQGFTKNENKDHSDVQAGLLGRGAHTGITDDSNAHASSKTSKATSETSTEIDHGFEKSVSSSVTVDGDTINDTTLGTSGRQTSGDDDCNNQSVNGNNTGENDGDDGAHHKLGLDNTHGGDTDTGLGSSVSGAKD